MSTFIIVYKLHLSVKKKFKNQEILYVIDVSLKKLFFLIFVYISFFILE